VVNLVEAATRVGGDEMPGQLARRRIGGIDRRLAEVDDRDDVLTPDELCVLGHGQTSWDVTGAGELVWSMTFSTGFMTGSW
jgi:hypothetical protein